MADSVHLQMQRCYLTSIKEDNAVKTCALDADCKLQPLVMKLAKRGLSNGVLCLV